MLGNLQLEQEGFLCPEVRVMKLYWTIFQGGL
jgi:hypothetical protein